MNHVTRIGLVLAAAIVSTAAAQAQSAGPNTASSVVDDASIGTMAWAAPSDAATSNNVYAGAAVSTGNPSHYLKATGFGFAVPPTAVIVGIEVDIERKAGVGVIEDNAVRIVKGGAAQTTDKSMLGAWPAADTVVTYGSPTDLWGTTWTPADINGAGFGAALSAKDSAASFAQVDAFGITVYYGVCGDGLTQSNEGCDDGNLVSGDCCDATCDFEINGSACADGDLCNGDETCDGAGNCAAGTPLMCDDFAACSVDSCSPVLGCVNDASPRVSCKTALKSKLIYKNAANDASDKLIFKWTKGQPTSFAELGLPTGTTSYTLCLYAGTTALAEATAPGGANWTVIGSNKGYKYGSSTGTPDGVRKLLLKANAANKTKALFKGKGASLPAMTVPLPLPLTAQLINDENSTCFTADFTTATKNVSGSFKAKNP